MEFHSPEKLYLLLCLSILLLSSFHAQASTFRYCADVNYAVKVSGVEVTPDPVVRARSATFKISATAGEAISGGKWVIRVVYIGLVVHKEIHDLCEEVSCPVTTGNFELTHTQKLPAFAPPVSSYIIISNFHFEQIVCLCFFTSL